MSDFNTKVHGELGGDAMTVEKGGAINFAGVKIAVDASGKVIVTGLPTADPHVVGALWDSTGVLTVSAG